MAKKKNPIIGGKGGGDQHTPVEAANSLFSIAYARIVDLVSEGEIVGLVNGLESIYLNETPVQGPDGKQNFQNYTIDYRYGTQTQDYIPGFPGVENELLVGVELTESTAYTRQFTNTDVNALRVRLSTPALYKVNISNGDTNGYTVNYAIDLSTDGGPWVQVVTAAFSGKTTTKYERSHRIDLPRAADNWQIRVRRTTANAASSSLADQTYVEAITELIDAKLRYPNSAIFGLTFDSKQFQNIPTRSYDLKGRIIRVPSNYDPETRVYTGIWNGTFKLAWTDNPAWCFYDIITNERYGLGHLLTDNNVNRYALYKIAQYCDELIPDGKGGTEPRFTCNLFLQSQADAFKVIQDMTSIFRGMAYWSNGEIFTVNDMPSDVVDIYNPSNVLDGKFEYQSSARKVRYTTALVSWSDTSDFGRAKIEYVADQDGIAKYGIQQTEVIAVGCTSQAMAQRMGRYILATGRYETNTVTFTVGVNGTIVPPGVVIGIADPMRATTRMGGRIKNMASGRTSVTVDSLPEIGVAIGDTLTVMMPDGIAASRTVSGVNTVTKEITVGTAFTTQAVDGAVWMLEKATLFAQKFRVVSTTENQDGTFTISALQYEPDKYAAADYATDIETDPITLPPPMGGAGPQDPPTNVVLTSSEVAGQVIAMTTLTIAWDAAGGAVAYEAQYRSDDGNWVSLGDNITVLNATVNGVLPGSYVARVAAIDPRGTYSPFVLSNVLIIADQTTPPTVVTDIQDELGSLLDGLNQEAIDRANDIATEAAARAAADAAMVINIDTNTTAIDDEAALRASQYAANAADIAAEAATRASQYAANAQAIADEAVTRANDDAANAQAIADEANSRATAILASSQEAADALNAAVADLTADIAAEAATRLAGDQQVAQDAADALAAEAIERGAAITNLQTVLENADDSLANNITTLTTAVDNNTAAIATETTARTTADSALANERELLATQLRGDYTGSDAAALSSGLIYQERTARLSADSAIAQQLTLLSVGVGEQFDYSKIWYFAGNAESWTGNGLTWSASWLKTVGPTCLVTSPAALAIDGGEYTQIRIRIRKTGAPVWAGALQWLTTTDSVWDSVKQTAVTEPAYDSDGIGVITVNVPWSATIDQVRLTLGTGGTSANYYEVDWVAIGRPAPGASSAALSNEQTARATSDAAQTTARELLAVKLIGQSDPTGLTIDTLASGLLSDERSARVTADTAQVSSIDSLQARVTTAESDITNIQQAYADADEAMAADITGLKSTVNDPTTGVVATATGLSSLTTRVTSAEGVNTSQAGAITALESTVNDPANGVLANASGISSLNTAVTTQGSTITSQGSAITALENTVNNGTTGVAATASGLSALTTRVTSAEGVNTSQGSAITQLQSAVGSGVLGPELIQDSGFTGTTLSANWTAGGLTATLAGGELHLVADATANRHADYALTGLTVGATYRFVIRAKQGSVVGDQRIRNWTGFVVTSTPLTASYADYQFDVVASATTATIRIYATGNTGVAGADLYIDRVSAREVTTTALTTALNSLDTRVTQDGDDIDVLTSDVTNLKTTVNNGVTGVAATASGLAALTTRVTTAEGINTSQSNDITALKNTVNDPTTGVAANSSAITTLGGRVTTAEGLIDSQADDITALQAVVTDPTTGNTALGTAVSSLATRVTAAEGDILVTADDVTALDVRLDTAEGNITTNSTAISGLTTSVQQNEDDIIAVAADVTALQTGIGAILGPELVPNWDFSTTSLTGYTGTGTTRTIVGGELKIVAADGASDFASVSVSGLEVGETYHFSCRAKRGAQGIQQRIQSFTVGTIAAIPVTSTTYDTYTVTFDATVASGLLRFYAASSGGAAGDELYLDWISLRKVTTTATADAINALDTRVQTTETGIASAASDITSLKNTVNDPTTGVSALNTAVSTLDTRITTNSGAITTANSDITALKNTVNDPSTGVSALNTALTTLTTRVTTSENDIDSVNADVTALENTVNSPTTGLSAVNTAITGLDTRVSATETDIDSVNADVTSLENTVNNATTGVAATATGLSNLTTRVTAAEGVNTSQGTAITALQNTVNDGTTGVAATATGLSALTTRVTTAEGDITALTSAVTDLLITVEDPATGVDATAAAVNALSTQVSTLDGITDNQSADITTLQNTVNNATTGVAATAAGLSNLTTRVTSAEGVNTSQGSAITALQNTVNNATTGVAATASGLSALTTRVTDAEGVNTSQGGAITALENTVNNATTGVAATSSAVSSLTSRVTAVEGTNTSQSSSITALENSVNNGTTGLATKASTTVTNALDSRITAAEGVNTSQGSSITAINSRLDDPTTGLGTKASTSALNALTTRVTTAEGNITAMSADITSLESDLSGVTSDVAANSTAITSLQTSVSQKNQIFYQTTAPSSGMVAGDLWIDSDANNKQYRYSGSAWVDVSDTDKITCFVQADAPTTVGRKIGDVWIETDNNNKFWIWSGSAWTSDGRIAANAAAITSLQSSVNDPTTGVSATASAVSSLSTRVEITEDGLAVAQAAYGLSLDVNGKVAGLYGLNNGVVSTLTFNFDNVSFTSTSGSSSIAGGIIVQSAGGYMSVSGPGFGANGDLMRWYGTVRAVNTCTKANAISYEDTSGHIYVPSITIGDITYYNSSSSNASTNTVTLNASETNGATKSIKVTYSFGASQTGSSSTTPTGSATLELWRKIGSGAFAKLGVTQTVTFTGTVTNLGGGSYSRDLEGSLEYIVDDTDATITSHTYEWRLLSRTSSITFGVQNMTIQSTETQG